MDSGRHTVGGRKTTTTVLKRPLPISLFYIITVAISLTITLAEIILLSIELSFKIVIIIFTLCVIIATSYALKDEILKYLLSFVTIEPKDFSDYVEWLAKINGEVNAKNRDKKFELMERLLMKMEEYKGYISPKYRSEFEKLTNKIKWEIMNSKNINQTKENLFVLLTKLQKME